MSYAANPNFGGTLDPDLTYIPTVGSSNVIGTTDVGVPDVAPNRGRVGKIIIIVVLVILIIISVILIFVFRSNVRTCEDNENGSCPVLICPVGQFGVIPDPDCGTSAFRFRANGTKMCSTTRYAPQ